MVENLNEVLAMYNYGKGIGKIKKIYIAYEYQYLHGQSDEIVKSPVQPPHPQIQIPRERNPHQIRQHQPCGRLRDAVKGNGSGEDQDPQSDQPQKGEKIPSQVEEPDGPEKIKNKLYGIQGEGFRVLTFLHDNEIRGDSHEDEQDAPHHREEPHGRCQGRLIHCFKGFHAVHGDPGGESACRQRDGNGSDEVFPVNIVKFVGELHGSLL